MKFNSLIIITLFLLSRCTPIAQTSTYGDGGGKMLQLRDMTYEPEIKTVTLHPATTGTDATLLSPVVKLKDMNLALAFDDLRPDRDSYYARIIHCNYDWTQSMLNDLDFMSEYNEFTITNFEFSVDTHIPYVHYWFNLPNVKVPGNYVVVVYRGGNKEDIVLTRRFMVYDQRVTFANLRNLVGAGAIANLNQQINFSISYQGLDIINPMQMINVSIRQNQRWDNMAMNIKPSFVREIEKQLEYKFFDDEKMFKGGNEFRFFDMRSLNSPGRNVKSVDKTVKPFEIYLERDKSRQYEAYSQYRDLDGGFRLDNYDYRSASFSNYAKVHFSFLSKPLDGKVYVMGAFNYWNQNKDSEMTYDSAKQQYEKTFLLKQGWYDYQYSLKSKTQPPYILEGSHFETENHYEIFIYYRALQPNADLLVGYVRLDKNQR